MGRSPSSQPATPRLDSYVAPRKAGSTDRAETHRQDLFRGRRIGEGDDKSAGEADKATRLARRPTETCGNGVRLPGTGGGRLGQVAVREWDLPVGHEMRRGGPTRPVMRDASDA